ncbi:Ig-like domain repeat protein [Rudaea sp.]|uniref:Ig-like domain repeat protein n=1 Tax=Rudaea sp. TaxID=2136325 RepID=UPI0032204A8D
MTFRSLCVAFVAVLFCAPGWAATITVDSTADTVAADGQVTLREAITAINAGTPPNGDVVAAGAYGSNDTIEFNIAGAGVHVITLAANLPSINKSVYINGYSQPGSSQNSNPLNAGINAVLKIEIAGMPGVDGLNIYGAPTTIRGLAIHGYRAIGVYTSQVVIAGNFIGTDAGGTTALPGLGGAFGIQVFSYLTPASDVTIGGSNVEDRNLIVPGGGSGFYGLGVQLPYLAPGPGTNYRIQGNYIGTDITGKLALSNGRGLDAISNAAVVDNLISGNPGGAIQLLDHDVVQGNLIGTQRDGVTPLGNGNFGGIEIHGGNSTIGDAAGNVIANNAGYGIVIYNGSTQGSSNVNTRNWISRNAIYANGRLGISLDYSPFVLANDAGDLDSWAADKVGNDGQNYPVITSAVLNGGNVAISGSFNGIAGSGFVMEFFASAACDASGYGQGQSYIGGTAIVTDASGSASFGPLSLALPAGQAVITATATDAAKNTSEFSRCLTATPAATTPATTTTTVVSSLNPSISGQSVTFTATVTGAAPTGSVQFKDGASNLGASAAMSGGVATLTTSALGVGTHPITAVYSGDPNNLTSTSAILNQVVNALTPPPPPVASVPAPMLGAWAAALLASALAAMAGARVEARRRQ